MEEHYKLHLDLDISIYTPSARATSPTLGSTKNLKEVEIASEERWCLEKYGDAYREYMKNTPRGIGRPK